MVSSPLIDLLSTNFETIWQDCDNQTLTEKLVQIITDIPWNSVKVISLIGGAASGKSTLAHTLSHILTKKGIPSDFFSTDDFLIWDRAYRRLHFESSEPKAKYDFVFMNELISKIRSDNYEHNSVSVPTYNQVTWVAIALWSENYIHTIGKITVLIVEGDFDEVIGSNLTFFLHMDDDDRLNNRLLRDVENRNEFDLTKIRENFEQRQITQHIPYTVPTIYKADYVIYTHIQQDDRYYDIYKKSYQKL